jgi:hypothetical protein
MGMLSIASAIINVIAPRFKKRPPHINYDDPLRGRLQKAYLTGSESIEKIFKSTFGGQGMDNHNRSGATWLVTLTKMSGRWYLLHNPNPLLPLGFTYVVLPSTCIVIAVSPELFKDINSSISLFVVEFFSQRTVDDVHYPNVYLVERESDLRLVSPNGEEASITDLLGQ